MSAPLKELLLSGNEALAIGAYEAGLRVAAAYPGTPSTEILQNLARFPEIDSQWSVNEKVAFEVAFGAAFGGARSLYASKHVGINVAMDPMMTSSYIGVNAGFVIVACDDPGMHSSQNEQDTRLLAKAAKIPLLEPSGPAEAYAFVKQAFDLSEKFDIPVIVRMTTRVSHSKENVVIGTRQEAGRKEFVHNWEKNVMVPRNAIIRHAQLEKRLCQLQSFAEKSPLNKLVISDRKFGIITSGAAYFYAKESFPEASFLKLGMPFPFPSAKVKEFAKKVKNIFVLEELEPFIAEHTAALGIKFQSKHESYRCGEITPELVADVVKGKPRNDRQIVSRRPQLCMGCPHRLVFGVLRNMNVTVAGDIGCYTLASLPPFSSLHTCLCMGTGVTFMEGLGRGIGKKVVGVIGDSTFVHSGITGLINAVYNGAKGVVIILDNATTAMTGGQPHPGTGVTIKGVKTKQLVLEKIVGAIGVDHVDVIDPVEVKKFEELLKQRIAEDALSVIIARRPCKLLVDKAKKVT